MKEKDVIHEIEVALNATAKDIKVTVTLPLDQDILDAIIEENGGREGYKTLINTKLREYVLNEKRSIE